MSWKGRGTGFGRVKQFCLTKIYNIDIKIYINNISAST